MRALIFHDEYSSWQVAHGSEEGPLPTAPWPAGNSRGPPRWPGQGRTEIAAVAPSLLASPLVLFLGIHILAGRSSPRTPLFPPRSSVLLPGTVPPLLLRWAPKTRGNSVGGWLDQGLFLM